MACFAIMLFACNNKSSGLQTRDVQLQQLKSGDKAEPGKNKNQQPEDQQIQAADSVNRTAGVNQNTAIIKNNTIDWDKKIIKIADIQLQLNNYKNFDAGIHSSLKNFGAYIADEKQTENDFKLENNLTIKVPVDQFDNLINSLAGDGIKITEKNISGEDVTGEVIDTKARMQAKMAIRDKYLGLLKQAKNMSEILQVQNEINDIQEDIEAANGRVNYLQHASAYSTIKLEYFEYINGNTGENKKTDFFTKLLKAFTTGTSVITNLVLFCISIWPLIVIGLFSWVYLKKLKLKKVIKA